MIAAILALSGVANTSPGKAVTFSVYATRYEGRTMANGQPYRMAEFTAASNRHKLGTRLIVRYQGRDAEVVVTDRMDKRLGRSRIDLSGAAYRALSPRYDMTDRTAGLLKGSFEVKW